MKHSHWASPFAPQGRAKEVGPTALPRVQFIAGCPFHGKSVVSTGAGFTNRWAPFMSIPLKPALPQRVWGFGLKPYPPPLWTPGPPEGARKKAAACKWLNWLPKWRETPVERGCSMKGTGVSTKRCNHHAQVFFAIRACWGLRFQVTNNSVCPCKGGSHLNSV